jgi:hypothetical protein
MPKTTKTATTATRQSARGAASNPIAKAAKPKDPKDSHLYTDDNPATTIHGTGFKDKAAALKTLDLIKKRSLIYQFQTVNTMYNRAKHHPAMKKAAPGAASTKDMREAMDVFKTWLEITYPAEKDALRTGGFKPLLSKKAVEKYLSQIEKNSSVSANAKQFARVYAELPKGKKLGNVLVDNSKPMEHDWEARRYAVLDLLVPKGKEEGEAEWKLSELWSDDREISASHLESVAWAWSPVKESKLL